MNFAITVYCPAIYGQDVFEMIYFATLNSLIIFDTDVSCISRLVWVIALECLLNIYCASTVCQFVLVLYILYVVQQISVNIYTCSQMQCGIFDYLCVYVKTMYTCICMLRYLSGCCSSLRS